MYTVLVEGDDMDEPISDAARSILDGHIVLSRQLAHRNHYPAIDVLQSISRCMPDVVTAEHQELANRVKTLMAAYRENEDLINIGAYVAGSNPMVDKSIRIHEPLTGFLQQSRAGRFSMSEALKQLGAIYKAI
jgi:flagellum-specific ATP synthase/type III secretion protein N (ATPase)